MKKMSEETVVFVNPANGQTYRCVKSNCQKHPGKDPWGNALSDKEMSARGI